MHSFCPKCGGTEGEFIKGFCKKCFLRDRKLIAIDKELEIEHCKRCNKIKLRGQWINQSEGSLGELIESKIKIKELINPKIDLELKPKEGGTTTALLTVIGEIDNKPLKVSEVILLKPKEVLCNNCTKITSNYYEAVLQVRFKEKPTQKQIRKKLNEVRRLLSYEKNTTILAEIVNLVEVRNGFDSYIASKRAGRIVAERLARKYGSTIVRSYKVKGVDKSGKPRKRFTYCVKI